jgi:D-alanine-D-alanine ligase
MTENPGKVAVLHGGISAEREVSLVSGAAVLAGLRASGVDAVGIDVGPDIVSILQESGIDRAWIALHGRWGEDGVMQGALEMMGIPYTGTGILGSALAMDKVKSKQIWEAAGLPTASYRVVTSEKDLDGVIQELGLPLFVKPSNEGSSVGVSRVEVGSELIDAWQLASGRSVEVLVEQFIDGDEVTVAILNGEALPVIRLQTPHTFYDYSAKYESDTTSYLCPSGLESTLEQELQELALAAFAQLGCTGWGRVDVMLDSDECPFLLEINTVPGMTAHSLVPMAAAQAGIVFNELVLRILETSL